MLLQVTLAVVDGGKSICFLLWVKADLQEVHVSVFDWDFTQHQLVHCLLLQIHKLDASGVSDHCISVFKAWHQLDSKTYVVWVNTLDLLETATSEDATLCSLDKVNKLILVAGN